MLKSESGEVKITKQIRNQNKRQNKNKNDSIEENTILKMPKIDYDTKE